MAHTHHGLRKLDTRLRASLDTGAGSTLTKSQQAHVEDMLQTVQTQPRAVIWKLCERLSAIGIGSMDRCECCQQLSYRLNQKGEIGG